MGDLVSVVIPARNERFLEHTIKDVIEHAQEEIEVLFLLDDGSVGMRDAISTMVEHAQGKYIMKLDAHCMMADGWDVALKEHHQPKWVQIPTRYRLNAHEWKIDESKAAINLMYLTEDFKGIANRTQDIAAMLHDTETFQGSCYFMERDYFLELGLFDEGFGPFWNEAQEIGIRVKADGGRIVRNKHTWYAHARLGRKYVAPEQNNYIKEFVRKYEH